VSTHAHLEPRRYGPSAFGDDLRRFVNLTFTLANTDFKLTYFGSALGYVWSLMRPLLFFGVLDVVFTQFFHVGKGVPHYAVTLLAAIIFWTFFLQVTSGCVQCLLAREGLLRKMRFPRLVIPLAVALTAFYQFVLNLIPVFAFALATGVTPRLSWLELPPLAILLAAVGLGAGMLLSVLYVRFRDIQPIWDITSQILFYGSPIIYPVTQYNTLPALGHVLMTSPVAAIITQMRHALTGGTRTVNPDAAVAIGGAVRLLIPLAIILAVFALGVWFFNREAPRIAENL
jgi:ABC-2 type transport system permease protein